MTLLLPHGPWWLSHQITSMIKYQCCEAMCLSVTWLMIPACSHWAIGKHLAGHEYDGGVMITASHLPYNRNGLKFFTKDGGFDKRDITELLHTAAAQHTAANAPHAGTDSRYLDSAWVLGQALQVDGSRAESVRTLASRPEYGRVLCGCWAQD